MIKGVFLRPGTTLTFFYSHKGEREQRFVRFERLDLHNGGSEAKELEWHLHSFDLDRRAPRSFLLRLIEIDTVRVMRCAPSSPT